MILALVLIFILILFLAGVIAAAGSAPGGRSKKAVSAREFQRRPPRRGLGSQRPASAHVESFTPHQQPAPELAETQVNPFTPAGRQILMATDELPNSYEGFFASANNPFTVAGRNDGDSSICFLTGQPKGRCQCAGCVNRRAR